MRLRTSSAPVINCEATGDRAVLEALYRATDGANWTNDTGWLSDRGHSGDWYGVTTDTEGRVTGLSLRENGLDGELPSELGQLTRVAWLLLGLAMS